MTSNSLPTHLLTESNNRRLSFNCLTGPIPGELSNLTELEVLDVTPNFGEDCESPPCQGLCFGPDELQIAHLPEGIESDIAVLETCRSFTVGGTLSPTSAPNAASATSTCAVLLLLLFLLQF